MVRTRTYTHRLALRIASILANNGVRTSKIKQHSSADLRCATYDDVHCDLVREPKNILQSGQRNSAEIFFAVLFGHRDNCGGQQNRALPQLAGHHRGDTRNNLKLNRTTRHDPPLHNRPRRLHLKVTQQPNRMVVAIRPTTRNSLAHRHTRIRRTMGTTHLRPQQKRSQHFELSCA